MLWLWVIAGLLAILVLFVISRVHIRLHIRRIGEDDHVLVHASCFYGLIRFKYEVPVIKFKGLYGKEITTNEQKEGMLSQSSQIMITLQNLHDVSEKIRRLLYNASGLTDWMLQFFRRMQCMEVKWHTHIGTNDAPQTAIAAGGLWATKTMMLGLVSHFICLNARPDFQVIPTYNVTQFKTEAAIHLRSTVWQCLISGVHLFRRISMVPGGMKVWRKTLFPTG